MVQHVPARPCGAALDGQQTRRTRVALQIWMVRTSLSGEAEEIAISRRETGALDLWAVCGVCPGPWAVH